MVNVDGFEIRSIVTGTFRLDGGAMFGVVPKVLWQNAVDVDPLNRIALATRTLLAVHRASGRVILVDTGCGTKWDPEEAARFAIRHDPEAIPKALAGCGLSTDDVTDVVVTHLHFDHNGGLTKWVGEPGGQTRLVFPRARHWVHERHWIHANRPHLKDRASFLKQDFTILGGSDALHLVRGEHPDPPFEGLRWFVSHGHTPYQLLPIFGAGGSAVLFVGDVFPTVAHLRPTWVMAYDIEPMRTIDEKVVLIRRCMDEGLGLAFPHDVAIGGGRITGPADRPIVASPLDL
jgi:glyoxylase-like metal-dependent hydrolase (beta-lactamase superfamily II)